MKLIPILILLSLLINAQELRGQEVQKNIEFVTDTYNFGSVNARNKELKYDFKFTNTTGVPVQIKNIDAPCGCTVPQWSKNVVPPNEQGNVKVLLRVNQLSGYFSRGIKVFTNISEEPILLLVTGRVLRNYRYNDPFKNKAGHLLSDKTEFNFGKITVGKEIQTDIKFINNSFRDTIQFTIKKKPKYLKVEQTKTTVVPGNNSMITLTIKKEITKEELQEIKEMELLSINPKGEKIALTIPVRMQIIEE